MLRRRRSESFPLQEQPLVELGEELLVALRVRHLSDGHDSPTVDDPALKVDPDAHSVTVGADVGGGIVCRRDIAARWPNAG